MRVSSLRFGAAVLAALLCVFAAFAHPTHAADEIVDPAIVPRTGRLRASNDSIVFDLPIDKTVVFQKYESITLNLTEVEATVASLESAVDDEDMRIASLQSDVATRGPASLVQSLAEEIDRLQSAVDSDKYIPETIGGATRFRVQQLVSQAEETNSLVSTINENFPAMISNLKAADTYTTAMLTGRIKYTNLLDKYADLPSLVDPHQSIQASLAEDIDDAKAEALSTVASYEAKLRTVESTLQSFGDISTVIATMGQTRFNNPRIPIIRARQFSTYMQCCGWYYGNRPEFYGGVNPSVWSDGNGAASSMSSDANVLRNLFNTRVTCGTNCAVFNEEWYSYSSTNGRHGVVLIRVRNTTPDGITWPLTFHYSSYGGYAERASIAMNGQEVWSSGNTCSLCLRSVNLLIPANQVNTIIVVVGGGAPSGNMRTTHLAFIDDSLSPPDGIEYVDDLDVATNGSI